LITTVTERLLAYGVEGKPAILRKTPAERMPAVRAVLREAAAHDDTWSSLLAAIARRLPSAAGITGTVR